MKKLVLGALIFSGIFFASAQSISFDNNTIDYGTIKNGADGQRFFIVKNTGNKPLIINKVQASCGCTTPEWDKAPILPGKTTKIKVGYNTKLNGDFKKMIEVYSNDPEKGRITLYIKGKVEPSTK
ncbi:MAG: DUF1573 domain-containing protein [Bergeyella zoohelcum]|nr:DUF1573 domain-containing protein [Bergeyella zoohelcum]